MPRQARTLSKSRIYHIMIRGNERRNIFLNEEDRTCFIDTIFIKLKASGSKLYAYCLMDNHVHLIIGEEKEEIAKIMKRINVSYVLYFNRKYKRVGHLFQDRFKSETIENDNYLLEAIRYIHNNPVKAGMVKKASEYKWSSYSIYTTDKEGLIEKETVLGIFSEDKKRRLELFKEFNEKDCETKFIECEETDNEEKRLEEEKEARAIIDGYLSRNNITNNGYLENKQIRNELIIEIRNKGGLSIRRIAEVLGVNRGIVQNVVREI